MKCKKQKVVLEGSKRNFVADKVRKSNTVKSVLGLKLVVIPNSQNFDVKKTRIKTSGSHGKVYNLYVFKGKHKIGLVVKEYHSFFLKNFPSGSTQSSIAMEEFKIFQNLRKKGYHVLPTTRLVEVNGQKYVAVTNLRKPGNILTDSRYRIGKLAGEKALEKVDKYVEEETKKALEEGIDILDAWEYVYDRKTRKVKAFIQDLGLTLITAQRAKNKKQKP